MPAMPTTINKGLTKREMFAMHAMQVLTARAADNDGQWTNSEPCNVAFEAVLFADAFLKELEK